MKIHATPERGLIDDRVEIRVTGAAPGGAVLIRGEATSPTGQRWTSSAVFRADPNGMVDLDRDRPERGGSYSAADAMGLFWSMKQADPNAPLEHFGISHQVPAQFVFSALPEGATAATSQATVTRSVLGDDVVATQIREKGIAGTLFAKRGAKRQPAVIVLGGSGGGLGLEPMAALLASRGFTALALAYFKYEGLAPILRHFPLEYFALAIQWLQSREEVDPARIGMTGSSKGAEATLLCASIFPELKAIVPNVGTSMVFGGRGDGGPTASPWSWRGIPWPFVPMPDIQAVKSTPEDPEHVGSAFHLAMRTQPEAVEKATIKAENAKAAILMLSAANDGTWPSAYLSRLAIRRLEEKGYARPYRHLSLPGGHALNNPNLPSTTALSPHNGRWLTLGGTPEDNHYTRVTAWSEQLGWFRNHL